MVEVPFYIQWGLLQISLPNFIVISLMIVIFIVVLLIPAPRHEKGGTP